MTHAVPELDQPVDLYPTRRVDEQQVTGRKDPVVYGTPDAGPLSRDELQAYERNGYLFFPGFFDAGELAPYIEELHRLRASDEMRGREGVITEVRSKEIRSVFGVHDNNALLARLCRDRRIVNVARQLLGSEVYFHHSRINYKPGIHGREFYWHSV